MRKINQMKNNFNFYLYIPSITRSKCYHLFGSTGQQEFLNGSLLDNPTHSFPFPHLTEISFIIIKIIIFLQLIDWLIDWFIYWLIGMLRVDRSGLVEEDAATCSITMVFTCPILSWCTISSPFRENNNVVVFPFLFHIFMLLANLWFIRLQG